MKQPGILHGALVGGLLTAVATALTYLANQLGNFPFPPFTLFNWMVRTLPGDLITFGIDMMIDGMRLLGLSVVDLAKTAERVSAILQFVGIGIAAGVVIFLIIRLRQGKTAVLFGTLIGFLFSLMLVGMYVVTSMGDDSLVPGIILLIGTFTVWGMLIGWAYHKLIVAEASPDSDAAESAAANSVQTLNRRQFLVRLGASAAVITVAGSSVGTALANAERRRREALFASQMATNSSIVLPNLDDPLQPVLGTRPEYTPIEDHYQVFLATEPSFIEEEGYILPITGLVDNPLMLTLDDIHNNYESFDQFVTLTCISGRVGTGLISTTQWSGVSMQKIVASLGVQPDAKYIQIHSEDGFYETISLDLINSDERIMLCHSWDGNPIPFDHGFPLRIWIPDRYGMKQPKWITSMEVISENRPGYWVERNWDEVAQVKATSVIDTVDVENLIEGTRTLVPVGGIAYAGDRGVSKVEVRVNGGEWQEAQLRTPLSETTWVVWRYEWPFEAGDHLFETRMVEADGTPQIEVAQKARPDGSSGIHSREATL
ncbi:MAG: molybdopterin-dependent oxidoreductase [Chloroflexota bacterium]